MEDFKLAGPTANLAEGWHLIRSGIRTEEPGDLGLYLSCHHQQSTRQLPISGKTVRVMEYDMQDFLVACVSRYRELTGMQYLRAASTPFLPEKMAPDFSDGYATERGEVEAAEVALRNAAHLQPYAAKVLTKVF